MLTCNISLQTNNRKRADQSKYVSRLQVFLGSCAPGGPPNEHELTLSKSFIFFGTNTSISDSNGPETILPFMYIIPPEPKTELCK
uniref:Uncharacterized protein n=1 Tax=Glossina palpalis gambiensis TaxID=67801 RepID=A0A1B0BHF0_9MUSC